MNEFKLDNLPILRHSQFFKNELVQLMNDDGGKSVFKENYRKTFKSLSV